MPDRQSGRSSGVEHNLAKVGVEGSNPFARSNDFNDLGDRAFAAEGGLTGRVFISVPNGTVCPDGKPKRPWSLIRCYSSFWAVGGLPASMRGSINSRRLCKSESLAFVANFADPTLVPIRPTLLNRSGCDQE
jgi:hypothetical protein